MRIWTERQIELRGVYEINLTSTALAALLASGHPALAEAKARRTHPGTNLHVGLLGASDWVLFISRVTPSNDCNPFHFIQGIVWCCQRGKIVAGQMVYGVLHACEGCAWQSQRRY